MTDSSHCVLTDTQKDRQRVVSAACRIGDSVICSPRHYDSICRATINLLPGHERKKWYGAEQGFVDQFGIFLTRREAWVIALKQNQIIRDHDKCVGNLYSEHLY